MITDKPIYSFCEPVWASSISRWHIRKLSFKGSKYGGGADTPALCGLDLRCGWDLRVDITDHHLGHTCSKCVKTYDIERGTIAMKDEYLDSSRISVPVAELIGNK